MRISSLKNLNRIILCCNDLGMKLKICSYFVLALLCFQAKIMISSYAFLNTLEEHDKKKKMSNLEAEVLRKLLYKTKGNIKILFN